MAIISSERTVNGHVEVDLTVSGILFDMDGTLMMSTPSVIAAWTAFAKNHGLDPDVILESSHGRRTIEILGDINKDYATMDHVRAFERTISYDYGHLAVPVPGVREFVNSLPVDRWGVVTSATTVIADAWLKILNLNKPGVLITAESVTIGKPNPAGYLKGKETLGLDSDFLVFEDAKAGVEAGRAAGAVVVGMATTYDAQTVKGFGAQIVIPDLEHIKLKSYDEKTHVLVLTVTDPQ